MKKIMLVLGLPIVLIAGLQLFGDRNFAQVSVAWEKYQYNGSLGNLADDIGSIFAGDQIKQGGLSTARTAERVMYRWIDQQGVVHNSERAPKNVDYQVIKMGELDIKTQKGMEQEEIDRALNGG